MLLYFFDSTTGPVWVIWALKRETEKNNFFPVSPSASCYFPCLLFPVFELSERARTISKETTVFFTSLYQPEQKHTSAQDKKAFSLCLVFPFKSLLNTLSPFLFTIQSKEYPIHILIHPFHPLYIFLLFSGLTPTDAIGHTHICYSIASSVKSNYSDLLFVQTD